MQIILNGEHVLTIKKINREDLPQNHLKGMNPDDFNEFWVAIDRCGNPYMWAGRGFVSAPKEIVVWYRSGNPWSGWKSGVADAFTTAATYAWMSA